MNHEATIRQTQTQGSSTPTMGLYSSKMSKSPQKQNEDCLPIRLNRHGSWRNDPQLDLRARKEIALKASICQFCRQRWIWAVFVQRGILEKRGSGPSILLVRNSSPLLRTTVDKCEQRHSETHLLLASTYLWHRQRKTTQTALEKTNSYKRKQAQSQKCFSKVATSCLWENRYEHQL